MMTDSLMERERATTAPPREKPIIFSAQMVSALLAGRKTMTRRILKPQPARFRLPRDDPDFGGKKGDWCQIGLLHVEGEPWPRITTGRVITRQEVRFAVGQTLWVREAFAEPNDQVAIYRANWREDAAARQLDNIPADDSRIRWRPSIHMPRSLCRITLRVTGVKIERLQDITSADALAEGALESGLPYVGAMTCDQARGAFSLLWDSIHGKLSWEQAWKQNPAVVALRFVREAPECPGIEAGSTPSTTVRETANEDHRPCPGRLYLPDPG